jgi:toxin CcdB
VARLDVYPAIGGGARGYLLDVQAARLDHLHSRAVVPLLPCIAAPPPIRDLNPVFDVLGEPHVVATHFIFTVSRDNLREAVASLSHCHDEICDALDFLFGTY